MIEASVNPPHASKTTAEIPPGGHHSRSPGMTLCLEPLAQKSGPATVQTSEQSNETLIKAPLPDPKMTWQLKSRSHRMMRGKPDADTSLVAPCWPELHTVQGSSRSSA